MFSYIISECKWAVAMLTQTELCRSIWTKYKMICSVESVVILQLRDSESGESPEWEPEEVDVYGGGIIMGAVIIHGDLEIRSVHSLCLTSDWWVCWPRHICTDISIKSWQRGLYWYISVWLTCIPTCTEGECCTRVHSSLPPSAFSVGSDCRVVAPVLPHSWSFLSTPALNVSGLFLTPPGLNTEKMTNVFFFIFLILWWIFNWI